MAPDRVSWSSASSHDGRRCDATIVPVSDTSSRVDLACGSRAAGGGVSSPMEVNQTRKALIELIDSTLEGRPYDHRLARGSTAAGWPKHALKAASYIAAARNMLSLPSPPRGGIMRSFAIAACALMLLSLAACGDGTTDNRAAAANRSAAARKAAAPAPPPPLADKVRVRLET